ncbi:hypothetical protein [Bacillus sp. FSL M8-0168]|uniref:hypothetical protein n=1 Tax=Bacillus sp. FSL M8-0168 TaxID=2921614 RepID=UPI0030FD9728
MIEHLKHIVFYTNEITQVGAIARSTSTYTGFRNSHRHRRLLINKRALNQMLTER